MRIKKKTLRQAIKVFVGISVLVVLFWIFAITQNFFIVLLLLPIVGTLLFVFIKTEKE